MARMKPLRSIFCAAAVLGLCSVAVAQQTVPPAEAPAANPPAVKPSETPGGSSGQDMVGLDVFSSDGTRVGEVRAVNAGPGGSVVALHVRTGGFLGFGGRTIAVPGGQFKRTGQSIRLDLDSDQVGDLPEVKD